MGGSIGFSLPKVVKQMPYWMMGYWLGLVTPREVDQVAMIEIITSCWFFTNPSEKYATRQIGSSPQGLG